MGAKPPVGIRGKPGANDGVDASSNSEILSTDDELEDPADGKFLSQKVFKALDRELPVRRIMEMDRTSLKNKIF